MSAFSSPIDACTALQSSYTCITDVNEAFVTERNAVALILPKRVSILITGHCKMEKQNLLKEV
jgi:hypothetical protein